MPDAQRFPYVAVKNASGQTALRPQMPITLTYNSRSVETMGLVDTGADVNVLPYQLGVELGAVWSDQTVEMELSGNLANFEARGIVLSASVGHLDTVRLAFARTQNERVPLLLGQVNFLLEFDVCFAAPKTLSR
jgi:hypothetical protein